MSQGQCHLQRTVGDTPHELDKGHREWQNTAANMWRCRGPGGSHRLQNGWGVARRGPRWVRLPYASARNDCVSLCAVYCNRGININSILSVEKVRIFI